MWSWWTAEYLRALHERHYLKHGDKKCSLAVGEVVIIKSSGLNRKSCPLGIIERLIEGRDGRVRGATLWAGQSHIEYPIQHRYPLELLCDREDDRKKRDNTRPWSTCVQTQTGCSSCHQVLSARFSTGESARMNLAFRTLNWENIFHYISLFCLF